MAGRAQGKHRPRVRIAPSHPWLPLIILVGSLLTQPLPYRLEHLDTELPLSLVAEPGPARSPRGSTDSLDQGMCPILGLWVSLDMWPTPAGHHHHLSARCFTWGDAGPSLPENRSLPVLLPLVPRPYLQGEGCTAGSAAGP